MNGKTALRLSVALLLLLAGLFTVAVVVAQDNAPPDRPALGPDSNRPAPVPLTAPRAAPGDVRQAPDENALHDSDDRPRRATETQCGWFWGGSLDYLGDVDYYKFYGLRGESFGIRVPAWEWGTGIDPTITLYGPNGTDELMFVDDYDVLDPVIHVTLYEEGWHYIAVRGFADAYVGDYFFTVDKPVYLSMNANGTVQGIPYKKGDVMVYYSCGLYWDKFLDARSLGIKGDLNGFALLPDRTALASFSNTQTFSDGPLSPNDVARCVLFDVGWDSWWDCWQLLDGSDVGLTSAGERVESIAVSPWGTLLLTFRGKANVPGIDQPIQNEDILEFYPYQFGVDTQGAWYWLFDGSDEGLAQTKTEGLWMNNFWYDIYQAFDRKVTLSNGLMLEEEDVGACYPWSWGADTYCGRWWELFDGVDAGLRVDTPIDAVDLGSSSWLYDPSPYPAPPVSK